MSFVTGLTLAEKLLLGSSALTAVSAVSQGKAARDQARFQAKVREQQAARERQVAEQDELDFRRKSRRDLATLRAGLGGAGVRIGTGTPLLAEEDFLSEVELQAQRIREGGGIRSTRLEQEAELLRASGKSAQRRGAFRAGASLLTGIGSVI